MFFFDWCYERLTSSYQGRSRQLRKESNWPAGELTASACSGGAARSSYASRLKRRRRLAAELLEDRRLLAVVTWTGASGNNAWENPGNWDVNRLPNAADEVILLSGANVLLTSDADVDRISINEGASLLVVPSDSDADKVAQLDAGMTVDGMLSMRREVLLRGDVDIADTGTIMVEGRAGSGVSLGGSALVGVDGDITNAGLIRFQSTSIDFGHPCCGGARAELELLNEHTLINTGVIHAALPPHGLRLDDIYYRLEGNVENRATVDIDFKLDSSRSSWIHEGTVELTPYSFGASPRIATLNFTESNVRQNGGSILGEGRVDLTKAQLQVDAAWSIEAGVEVYTNDTVFSGASPITIASGASLFAFNSSFQAPLHVDGTLIARGIVSATEGLTNSSRSTIRLHADYDSGAPRNGDALLRVVGGFHNLGTLQFYAEDRFSVHPTVVGDEARLVIQAGELLNEGRIETLEPKQDQGSYFYEIAGNWNSTAEIDLNYPLMARDGVISLDGEVRFGTYDDHQGTQLSKLIVDDADLNYFAPAFDGKPAFDFLSSSQLVLREPLTLNGDWRLDTDTISIEGPEKLTIAGEDDPNGRGYLFLWQSEISAPLEVQGLLDVRGANRISGPLSVDPGGMLRLYAYQNDLYNVLPKSGDSILRVNHGFTNRGEVQLWPRKGLPGWHPGHTTILHVESGELVNEGVISNRATETNFTPTIQIDGNVVNRGSFRFDEENLQIVNGSLTNEGSLSIPVERELHLQHADLVQLAGEVAVDGHLRFGASKSLRIEGGNVSGVGTIVSSGAGGVQNVGGVLRPGSPVGKLNIQGTYSQQSTATLAIDIAGLEQVSEYDQLHVSGSTTLGGQLQVNFRDNFTPSQGERFSVLTSGGTISGEFSQDNLAGRSLGFEQSSNEITLVGQTALPEILFELGELGRVLVAQSQLLNNPTAQGAIAELFNLRFDLLPDESGQPLFSLFVDQAIGLDQDGVLDTIEGFRIDGATVTLGDLIIDALEDAFGNSTSGPSLSLGDTSITFSQFSGFLNGDVSGNITLTSLAPELEFKRRVGALETVVRVVDDPATSQPALVGVLDLASASFQLTADRFEVELEEVFQLQGRGATVVLDATPTAQQTLMSVDTVDLTLKMADDSQTTLSADDLAVTYGGQVNISRAAVDFSETEFGQSLAGILPWQVTRVSIASIGVQSVELRSFAADVTVEGYFAGNLFSDLPFTPSISIGGEEKATGSSNRFVVRHRLKDGQVLPWDIGPIVMGVQGVEVAGLTLDGELRLGGYKLGAWDPQLSGFLSVASVDAGDPHLQPFLNLRFDILPEGSALSFGDNLFAEGGELRVMGQLTLNSNFQGRLGGVEVAGATLGVELTVNATPVADFPFVQFSSSIQLGELSLREVTLEVDNLGSITSSLILFDLSPDDPLEPIGRIANIVIQPFDNAYLSGLEAGRVDVFDALLYRDRLELQSVVASYDGVITWNGETAEDSVDLLLVDDLKVVLSDVIFTGDFTPLLDLEQTIASPFMTASFNELTIDLDRAILLPESNNPDDVPGDEGGSATGETLDNLQGAAFVTGVHGTLSGSNGSFSLTVDHLQAQSFDVLNWSASGLSMQLSPTAGPNDLLLMVDEATLSVPIVDKRVQLTVSDVQVTQAGEISFGQAIASGGAALRTFPLVGMLPVVVDTVEVKPLDGESRIVINRDSNGDGVPEPEFDIRLQGDFNMSVFSALGLSATARIGDGLADTFDATFRVTEEAGEFTVAPWQTGPIMLGLAAGVEETEVGLSFAGELTLGGYAAGNWVADLSGVLASNASLVGDDAQLHAGLEIRLGSGSSLTNGNLTLNTQVQFDAQATGEYLGLSISGLTLGFQMVLDWGYTNQAPHIFMQSFDVYPGEVSLTQLTIDIAHVGTLTVSEVHLDPNAAAEAPIATIASMVLDLSHNSLLSSFGTTMFAVNDSYIYRDRLRLGSVAFLLDGTVSSGNTPLLALDELLFSISGIEISGNFDPQNLNQTISITANTPLLTGSLQELQLSVASAVLLPHDENGDSNFGITAGVEGLLGHVSVVDGTIEMSAERVWGNIYDVFTIDSDPITLLMGPGVAAGTPFLQVHGVTTLGITLLDDKTIELYTNDFQISQAGVVSISAAGVAADRGLLRSIGLAEGLLPFDLTLVELAAPAGQRLTLNDTDLNVELSVQGFLDLSLFDGLPFRPVIAFGDQSTSPDQESPFSLKFGIQRDPGELLPSIRLIETGVLTLGIADFQVGPFIVHGRNADGSNDHNAPATITLGSYSNGVWNLTLGLNVGIAWDGLAADGTPNSSLDFDAQADVQIDPQTSRLERVSATKTELRLDASLHGSLGLGNLPLEADEPTDGAWGFRFEELGLNLQLAFAVRVDASGFRLEAIPNTPIIRLAGIDVASVDINVAGVVNMAATNVAVDLSVYTRNAQGEIVSNGPFLTFGGQRPTHSIDSQDDLDNVDGAIEVSVGFAGLGLGGKAGNFGIGWNPDQVNLQPEAFSLGLEFFQLPGFFLALVQPEGNDTSGGQFNFGMDWFPINIEEIGLRFQDVVNPANLEPFLELLPGGGGSPASPGGEGIIERATSYGMNLLQQADILFSGGFDSSSIPLIGELIDLNGQVENVEVDIGAMMSCAEYVWDQRHTLAPALRELMEDVQNNPGVEIIGGRLLAMAAMGASLFTRPECPMPLKGFDAIDGGAGLSLGPIDIAGGLGFGLLDYDRNGDATDGDEAQVLFVRLEGQFVYDNMGLGAEVVITEFGPILSRVIAGAPIPIGTLIGAAAGTVVPGPGNAIGSGIGSATGFMLNGLQGGIVFDGDPLPIIETPIDLIENFEIQVPMDLDIDEIRAATEKLFRNADGSLRTDADGNPSARYVWDSGFTMAVSGFLTNTYVANQIGMNITLGLNVGYDLPDYKLPGGMNVVEALRTGAVTLDDLPGSLGVVTGVSQETLNTALDAYENPGDLTSWEAFAAALTDNVTDQVQLDVGGFLRGFPFGMQLYGLGDLEVFGFPIGGVAAMLDFSDPINPKFDLAGQLPKSGTLLGALFPAQGEFELQLKSDGLVEGAVVAVQTFLEKVFATDTVGGTLAAGGAYFAGFFNRLVEQLNELPDSPLAQFLIDGISDVPQPMTLAFVRDRLLGRNGLPGIFAFDMTNPLPSLDAQAMQQAALVAANLMRQLMSPDASTLALLEDSLPDDPLFQQLLNRAEAAIFDSVYGMAALGNPSTSSLARARELIDGAPVEPNEDPIALALFEAYQRSVGGIKAQIIFTKALGEVILDSGQAAANAYFDTINPSLLFRGGIQPTVLGIPLSETGLQVPGVVENLEESFELAIDKHGISLEADVALVDKLLRVMALPLPIYDRVKMSVRIPTENLLRDLALYQPWEIDPTRDWRGTFRGTVGVGYGGLGFDLGDIGGLIFPAVGPAADPSKPREGLPDDHPLMTDVHIINPNTPTVLDRIQVTEADFLTMREQGGILLDGRLTVPRFISDPLLWFHELKDQVSTGMPMCSGQPNLLDCFMELESFEEYLEFFTTLYDETLEFEDAIIAKSQLAQVQLYVPNVFQHISQMVDIANAGLQTRMVTIFDTLADGVGTIESDVSDLVAQGVFSQGEGAIQAEFQQLLEMLEEHAYLRGVVGTAIDSPFPTSKLFGINFGGAMLEVDDGKLKASGFFPPLQPDETPDDYSGLRFDALVDLQDDPAVDDYPRAGVSVKFGTTGSQADPALLNTFLTQSGLGQLPFLQHAGSAFASVGDWLFSGVAQNVAQTELHVYTPGYEPDASGASPLVNSVKRDGGLAITSSLQLNSFFGSITGDIEVGLLPSTNSPLGVTFAGQFHGSGTFSLEDPFGVAGKLLTFDLPSVSGVISPSGCVSVELTPGMGIPLSQPIHVGFALAPGACDVQVILSDLSVPEPPGDEQTTISVPVRIEQVPAWSSGELVLKYDVSPNAEYGTHFVLFDFRGDMIPPSSNAWQTGELRFAPEDVQLDSNGLRFAEKFIQVRLIGDGSLPPDGPLAARDIRFSFLLGATPPQFDLVLDDSDLRLIIEEQDFVVPIRPGSPAIFFDFDDRDNPPSLFSDKPDETSTLDYRDFSNPAFYATHDDGDFAGFTGLPDTSDAVEPGWAYREPLDKGVPLDSTGLPHGFQFTVEVSGLFHPDYLEFWDRPIQFADDRSGESAKEVGLLEEWEVYVMVNGGTPILLDAMTQFVVDEESTPNAHPALLGWRKNRIDIGNRLREPTPNNDAVDLGPQFYFSGDRQLTFRLVPVDRGDSALARELAESRRRVVDNVVLTQRDATGGGSFGGRNLSFDEFLNGRIDFDILSGPGEWQIVFGPADPNVINPVPFEDVTPDIYLWGSDETTVVSVTDTRRNTDGPLNLGTFNLGNGAGKVDLSGAGLVAANIVSSGVVREITLDGLAVGSTIRLGGRPDDSLLLTTNRPLGDGTPNGFVLEFPGRVSLDGAGIDGGLVSVGSLGQVTSRGLFSPTLDLQRGFERLDIQGDFLSRSVRTGLARGSGNGSSGDIYVTGKIQVDNLAVDGDLNELVAIGGSIYLGRMTARSVDSIRAESRADSETQADITGNISVSSLGRLATVGGDIDTTLVTRDVRGRETQVSAIPDSRGRGGTIRSRNSLYLNSPVASIQASVIDANIVASSRVGQVVVGSQEQPGAWRGNLIAGHFGTIQFFGTAGGFIQTTDVQEVLPDAVAIEQLLVQGEMLGGALQTVAGTKVQRLEVVDPDSDGSLQGEWRIDGDIESLHLDAALGSLIINGQVRDYSIGRLDDSLIIGGQHTGDGLVGSMGDQGRVIVDGVPQGDRTGGRLLGRIFTDINRNAIQEGSESALVDMQVRLHDEAGGLVAETRSFARDWNRNGMLDLPQEDGWFVFGDLPAGDYSVSIEPPEGWTATNPGQEFTVTPESGIVEIDLGMRLIAPWNNWSSPFDVNRDTRVTPLDILLIVNYLNSDEPISVPYSQPQHYLDTSADNLITPLDILRIINFLNDRNRGESEWSDRGQGEPGGVDSYFAELALASDSYSHLFRSSMMSGVASPPIAFLDGEEDWLDNDDRRR